MRKTYQIVLVLLLLSSLGALSPLFAQKWHNPDKLHLIYSGTIIEKGLRVPLKIGFYHQDNEGQVAGEVSVPGEIVRFTGAYNPTTKDISFDGYDLMGDQKHPRYGYFFGKKIGGKIQGRFSRYRDTNPPSLFVVKLAKTYKK